MDIELAQVLDSISATQEQRDILLHRSGPEGQLLQIIQAIEYTKSIPDFELIAAMNDTYFEVVDWAEQAGRLISTV